MDIKNTLDRLRTWSKSDEFRAMRLASKDFKWWLREIESARKEGKRYCKDSLWVWYVHMYRSNAAYCKALNALLGNDFKVEIGIGYGSDTMEEYTFDCVEVSW